MLGYLWMLSTPVTLFRGWQVSSVAVSPVLERIGVALMVSIVPVAVAVSIVEGRRRGTLGDRLLIPWWCVVAITLLGFPVLFGAMSFSYDRKWGHSVIAAALMTLMWLAPHTVALSGMALSMRRDEKETEPVVVDIGNVAAGEEVNVASSVPEGLPRYRPGTAPDHLLTDWQLSKQGLRPGGPPQAWLLLDQGPGMYLYDVDESKQR